MTDEQHPIEKPSDDHPAAKNPPMCAESHPDGDSPLTTDGPLEAGADGVRLGFQDPEVIRLNAIEVLQTIYDPEIPVNIWELGLIYGIEVKEDGHIDVRMTLTSPACPVAPEIVHNVETKLALVPGVTRVTVAIVWDPPYSPDMMSEAARLQLGLM
jgi:FeS assembly SUF system protein